MPDAIMRSTYGDWTAPFGMGNVTVMNDFYREQKKQRFPPPPVLHVAFFSFSM